MENKVTCKHVVIKFVGNDTKNEIYKLTLSGINDLIAGISDDKHMLHQVRLQLLEAVAIVENYSSKLREKENGYFTKSLMKEAV